MSVENLFPNKEQMAELVASQEGINDALIAIADKLGAYAEPASWGAIQGLLRAGLISRHLSTGDVVEVAMSAIVTAHVDGSGVTAAAVNKDTFMAMAGSHTGSYVFEYSGSAWHYSGSAVSLSDYGITPTGTPADGDSITVTITASTYDFDVDGLDEECPVDTNREHVLPIMMRDVYSLLNFDPPQFLYAIRSEDWPSGLPAGTYNITLSHADYNDGGTKQDGTYQFTTTKVVPVGGGIRHTIIGAWQSDNTYTKAKVLAGTFVTYAADTYTTIESGLATTEGSSGTNLGTTTAENPSYKVGDAMNYSRRQGHGSNRWSTSYIRQLLNSEDAVLAWERKTIWSRNLNIQPEGFLHALDPELKAVLGKVRKRYALGQPDGYGYEDVEDFVTLATMLDVFGSNNNGVAEGPVDASGTVKRTTATSLWQGSSNADRIKTQNGTARSWWLGSVLPSHCNRVRYVNTSGALYNNFADNSNGVVPRLYIV